MLKTPGIFRFAYNANAKSSAGIFRLALYHGLFEKEPSTGLPYWHNQTRLAKENSPESNKFWRVPEPWPEGEDAEHKLSKTGDHKDVIIVAKRFYSWHKEAE
jgi:hypothetical protein